MIECMDTGVALLAGMIIIPAIYVFLGVEGMAAGPGLLLSHYQRCLTAWAQPDVS